MSVDTDQDFEVWEKRSWEVKMPHTRSQNLHLTDWEKNFEPFISKIVYMQQRKCFPRDIENYLIKRKKNTEYVAQQMTEMFTQTSIEWDRKHERLMKRNSFKTRRHYRDEKQFDQTVYKLVGYLMHKAIDWLVMPNKRWIML